MTRTDLIRIGKNLRDLVEGRLLHTDSVPVVMRAIAGAAAPSIVERMPGPNSVYPTSTLDRASGIAFDALDQGYNDSSMRQNREPANKQDTADCGHFKGCECWKTY